MARFRFLCYLVLILISLVLPRLDAAVFEDDLKCLEGFKKSLEDPAGNLNSWNFKNTTIGAICKFTGVTCWNDNENRIISLTLSTMNLGGKVTEPVQYCASLTTLDLSGPSRCSCCKNYATEDTNHLFRNGELADEVWNYFNIHSDIFDNHNNIRSTLMNWWLSDAKNKVHSFVQQCTPIVICWELWKARCSHRYEGIKCNPLRVISQVISLVKLLINSNFPCLKLDREWHIAWQQIEVLKPRLDIRCIKWIKPIKYKLNTDGCSKGNPGKAGGGGILRNERGHLIMAYAEYFGECSNNMSEAKAILFGIEWCLDKGFTNILVESDSMLIINMINGKAKTPWQIKHIIEDIHSLKVQGTFSFQHCYREVNMIADYLANMGVYTMQRSFFTEFLSLPMRVKKLMKNEIEELPTFRIRAQTKTFSFDHG